MMRKIAEGITLGLKYEIYDNTGVVDHIEVNGDTLKFKPVEGHNYIRVPEFGTDATPQPHHQTIHLRGETENIELDDVEAPAKSGEALTLFSVRQANQPKGAYFRFFNHKTHQVAENPGALRDQLFPWPSLWSVLLMGLIGVFYYMFNHQDRTAIEAFFITSVTMPVLFVPMYLVGLTIGLVRMAAVRNNASLRHYAAHLF